MSRSRTNDVEATPARRLAHDVLVRLDSTDAWVAPTLDSALGRAGLDDRERRLATELVYGVTRQRRRLDHVLGPHMSRPPDPAMLAALRIGALQLVDHDVEPHAAVSQAVSLVPRKARGFANAVLRRLSESAATSSTEIDPGDVGVALSYPDWIVERLSVDLGPADAYEALSAMNHPVQTPLRDDGYRQDPASAWVVDLVEARRGELVADVCAAPGGKTTGLSSTGAAVVALELHHARSRRLARTVERVDGDESGPVHIVTADATSIPLPPGRFDRVLLDAPCSGLGALRRRADARWRLEEDALARLADLQVRLFDAAASLVRDGGRIVYSVCTVTAAETTDVIERITQSRADLRLVEVELGHRWRRAGSGVMVLPHDHETDGMFAAVFERDRSGGIS